MPLLISVSTVGWMNDWMEEAADNAPILKMKLIDADHFDEGIALEPVHNTMLPNLGYAYLAGVTFGYDPCSGAFRPLPPGIEDQPGASVPASENTLGDLSEQHRLASLAIAPSTRHL